MNSADSHFPGVIVPLVTPFHDDGSLALEVLPALVEFVLGAGVAGLVVAGTTGEGYALDMAERADVLRTVLAVTRGRVPVLAGVGGTATREAVLQARLAVEAGVQGLMLAAPAYCVPTGDELGRHVLAVLRATELPTVLYDYPARTGVPFDVTALDLVATDPMIVGIKEASGDLSRISLLRDRYGDHLSVVCGSDTLAMHYFEAGSDSWIAGFAGALPAEHVAMLAAAARRHVCRLADAASSAAGSHRRGEQPLRRSHALVVDRPRHSRRPAARSDATARRK
ncbi:MAG: dihydrodipicolinate synthase family protein [Acidimicrobiaceae bacterium]|nr:dihydrodipicolinate synthase family protein [Acidimicrobiaceae bacterium]